MCVPTSFSYYTVSLHYFVPRNYILHNSCYDMTSMWHTICCWRSIIKSKISFTFIHVKILFYNIFLFPDISNFMFHSNKPIFKFNFFIHKYFSFLITRINNYKKTHIPVYKECTIIST